MHAFARMATPIFPIMDNLYLESFSLLFPTVWYGITGKKFNGYQVNPGDSTDFTVPQITGPEASGVVVGSLADYMGIPQVF